MCTMMLACQSHHARSACFHPQHPRNKLLFARCRRRCSSPMYCVLLSSLHVAIFAVGVSAGFYPSFSDNTLVRICSEVAGLENRLSTRPTLYLGIARAVLLLFRFRPPLLQTWCLEVASTVKVNALAHDASTTIPMMPASQARQAFRC